MFLPGPSRVGPRRLAAWLCPFLFALVLAPSPLRAQSQATTGVIRGVVTDSAGGPITAATVTLRNVETNFTRTLASSDRGIFVGTLLPLGSYEVTARALGYSVSTQHGISLRVGQTVEVPITLARLAVGLSEVRVSAQKPLLDVSRVEAATALSDEVVAALPNNGRNYLNLTLLTPNVAIVQGPDGDELSIGGQRGIHNNVSVDGADFNNPFFGEQRGGQRPAFTFNLDAVREVVVVSQGANAEFGRSGGGFVNVITKSGTNQLRGSAHYYGKYDALSASARHDNVALKPDFRQHQFGFTLGGPLVRDKAFFFVAYDQQVYNETKARTPLANSTSFNQLQAYLDTAFTGILAGDYGPVDRTNDANALLAKLDIDLSERHNFSLKYNYTNSRQENGTFDVNTWGRSANGVEKDYSHAVNGSLASQLSSSVSNELRFQLAREDRPRPYSGPLIPGQSRPFPDTGMDFENGFRFGLPFFLPITAYDTRIQLLDNVSWVRGDHLFKVGGEWNRTEANQTFIGFANGRFIFSSVQGFINYRRFGNGYVECANAAGTIVATDVNATCPGGTTIAGPVLLYLQQAGVGGRSVEDAGTQSIPQHDLSFFVQDSWKPTSTLTVNYGLRWEAQIEPDPITPPDQVFFAPFIGRTIANAKGLFAFPSDGTIPSDWKMFQPRFGVAWDVNGDGRQVLRASTGLYYARVPGLNLASTRSTNGSIGQTIFRNSAATPFIGRPPVYDQLLPAPAGTPFQPDVFVFDKNFRNPRTFSSTIGYERELISDLAASVSYTYARTDFLTRFINRNDTVFAQPFRTNLSPVDPTNGVGVLTVVESSAKSRYNGLTLGLKRVLDPRLQFQVNYTLSYDKADDDNERDPFSFRYARPDSLQREYNWSDRDQRHRFNGWVLARVPGKIYLNNRVSYYSAQPTSEACGAGNVGHGVRAASPSDRICKDTATAVAARYGSILQRNTLRKNNEYFSWDVRISRPFETARGQLEAIVEVFNVLNADNFRDPAGTSLLFNFDGTIRSGLGDPRQVQAGVRYLF
jgi:carboxypeptidase family protein